MAGTAQLRPQPAQLTQLQRPGTEFSSCVKVEVAVLGSQFLAVFMVSVDVAATLNKKETSETRIVRSRHTDRPLTLKTLLKVRKPLTLNTPLTVTPESL